MIGCHDTREAERPSSLGKTSGVRPSIEVSRAAGDVRAKIFASKIKKCADMKFASKIYFCALDLLAKSKCAVY